MNSGNLPLDQSKVPASIITPPSAVPFPLMYLVKEWITILAPCSIGFKSAGVATVLSTMNGTFDFFAYSEIPFKSKTSSFGLPNESAKNTLVFC